jgi:hypothetical protein
MPIPWTHKLDVREVMGQRLEAFRQHTSQAPLMEKTKDLFEELGQFEYYTQIAAREPQPAEQSTSLFAGLKP